MPKVLVRTCNNFGFTRSDPSGVEERLDVPEQQQKELESLALFLGVEELILFQLRTGHEEMLVLKKGGSEYRIVASTHDIQSSCWFRFIPPN